MLVAPDGWAPARQPCGALHSGRGSAKGRCRGPRCQPTAVPASPFDSASPPGRLRPSRERVRGERHAGENARSTRSRTTQSARVRRHACTDPATDRPRKSGRSRPVPCILRPARGGNGGNRRARPPARADRQPCGFAPATGSCGNGNWHASSGGSGFAIARDARAVRTVPPACHRRYSTNGVTIAGQTAAGLRRWW
jgi:hypothetical protein